MLELVTAAIYSSFKGELENLNDAARQALTKTEYAGKYGHSLSLDLAAKMKEDNATEADRINFKNMLTGGTLDMRQDFYDLLDKNLASNSGAADWIAAGGHWDGARTYLARALNQTAATQQEFNSQFKDLPPEQQKQLIELYATALTDYRTSKGQLTDSAVNMAEMAGATAATIASGGAASPLMIAAMGSAGAVFEVTSDQSDAGR